jgi:hypothetical protein
LQCVRLFSMVLRPEDLRASGQIISLYHTVVLTADNVSGKTNASIFRVELYQLKLY